MTKRSLWRWTFKPGTYEGEGKGIGGTIKLEVTVTEDEITDIKVLEHNETPGVSDQLSSKYLLK